MPGSPLARKTERLVGSLGWLLLITFCLLALFPAMFAPYDPYAQVGNPLEPPSAEHLLGTNDIGQDLLSELIWGTRVSLVTGLSVALLASALGVAAGLVSGYTKNAGSEFLLRLTDLTLVLPFLPLVILLAAYLGPGQSNVILVLTLVFWAVPARVIRARTLALSNELYVEAARALGSSQASILIAHLWPGVRNLARIQFILVASACILAEASLSFLGLGNPAVKSWGGTLYFARASGAFLGDSWRWWVFPAGLMISLAVLSLVMIGYSLEERQGFRIQ
jgi:ABC-type dipeptide/oligopeptide/nickel transport system permease subunit